jgi:hypothetical protein
MHLAALCKMKEQTESEELRVFIHSPIHSLFILAAECMSLLEIHSPFQKQFSTQFNLVLLLLQFTVSCLFLKVIR